MHTPQLSKALFYQKICGGFVRRYKSRCPTVQSHAWPSWKGLLAWTSKDSLVSNTKMQVIGLVPAHHYIKARWLGLLPSEVRPFRLSLMALPKCRKFRKGFRWFVAIPMCKAHNAKILKRMMMLGDAEHPGKQTKSCTSNKANKVLENTPPFSLQMKSSKKTSRFPSRSWTCFHKQNDSCHKGKTFDDDANTVNINHPMFSSFQPPTKCFSIEHPIHQSNQNTSNLKAASKQLRFQKEIRCNLVISDKVQADSLRQEFENKPWHWNENDNCREKEPTRDEWIRCAIDLWWGCWSFAQFRLEAVGSGRGG